MFLCEILGVLCVENMNLSSLGEFGLIARLHEKLTQRDGVRVGIGDDAALLKSLNSPIVTCDALVEGVHFRLDWTTARALGWKAIAVNVSDIAAMGGLPVAAFISLALPPNLDVEFIEELYAGMEEAAGEFNLTIAGGDTVKSPALMLSVTLIGNAPRPVLRSGAAPGDVLLVTGTLGDSAAGLQILLNSELELRPPSPLAKGGRPLGRRGRRSNRDFLLSRHRTPTPRLREMQAALKVENAVRAALDLSDGLAGDAAHIARQSDVTLEIETERLPISQACRAFAEAANRDALSFALTGGEDYELLLCIAPNKAAEVIAAVQNATGTPVTRVGRCIVREEDAPVILLKNGVRQTLPAAFTHF